MMYSRSALESMGFKKLGQNVLISDRCSIYGARNISIGNNVRIDDFCILSAGSEIIIGDYIHIACYASMIGRGSIILEDFTSVAARCNILSSCDDFSGGALVNPMIAEKYLNVLHAPVVLKKHAVLGAGTVVLPGVTIHEGAAVGALSLIKKDVPAYQIWVGNPARYLKDRLQDLTTLERNFLDESR
jgi:dTDP-4-amino-4,6-dideoxy-D-glucose acyltransferase